MEERGSGSREEMPKKCGTLFEGAIACPQLGLAAAAAGGCMRLIVPEFTAAAAAAAAAAARRSARPTTAAAARQNFSSLRARLAVLQI